MSTLQALLDGFFKSHPELEPNDDNRRELIRGIEELHKSVVSDANLEDVLKQHKDVFMFRKQLPPVFWPVAHQTEMLNICSQRLGFRILTSNANIHTILSLLQRAANGVVTLDSVYAVCETLGRSGLEHHAPAPAAPPPPPPAPRPIKFDWYSIGAGEIPLVDPIDGNPPPTGYLQSNAVSSAQLHSLIRRQEMQKKPYLSGYPDQGLANKSRR